MGLGFGDRSQLTVLITAASKLVNMRGETEFLVQNKSEISDRVKEGDKWESFSHKTMVNTRLRLHSQMNWVFIVFRRRWLEASQIERTSMAEHKYLLITNESVSEWVSVCVTVSERHLLGLSQVQRMDQIPWIPTRLEMFYKRCKRRKSTQYQEQFYCNKTIFIISSHNVR